MINTSAFSPHTGFGRDVSGPRTPNRNTRKKSLLSGICRRAMLLAILFVSLVCFDAKGADGNMPLVNADIVAMTRSNTPPLAIVSRIYASATNFDLSDAAFLQLKESGVADEVLNAMLASAKGGVGTSRPGELALPPLGGTAGSSFSSPPFGGDISLTPPELPTRQGSTLSFTDMPGFDDLPAFGELPGLTGPSTSPPAPAVPVASSAQAFSPPAAAQSFPVQQPAARAAAAPVAAGSAPATRVDGPRFERELLAVAQGTPEGRRSGLAWMFANREQTLPVLRQTLDVPRPEYQAAALQALGSMNDQASVGKMRDMLGNASPLVRQYAAQALAELNDSRAIATAEQNIGGDINPKDGLIRLVGYARLTRASETLASVLASDPVPLNRAAAAWSLAEIGPAASVAWPALEKALTGDADGSVRREAAAAVAAFHYPKSAQLLRNACRRDPEVRKVVLEAMADYPEMVEFLVGVMNLGPDLIAPDEVEVAAKSLARLTGQNFALDGRLWQIWYDGNKARLASMQGETAVTAATPVAPAAAVAAPPSASSRGVDIATLGMVVDPADIPMAPEVDAQGRAQIGAPLRAPGVDALAGYGYDPNAPLPGALSIDDFDGGFGTAEPTGPISSPGSATAAAPAAVGAPGPFSAQWGKGITLDRPTDGMGMSGVMGSGDDSLWSGPASTPAPSAMPTGSVVGQPPMGGAPASPPPIGEGSGGGLRLALPPMGLDASAMGDGGPPSAMLGTVAAGAALAPPTTALAAPPVEPQFDDGRDDGETFLYTPPSAMAGMESEPADYPPAAALGAGDMMEGIWEADTGVPAELMAAPAAATTLPFSDSIDMDAILQDGFAGEVIIPKAGVDSGAALLSSPASSPLPDYPDTSASSIPDFTEAIVSPVSEFTDDTLSAIPALTDDDPVEMLSFPGDTSEFGLGAPLFTETGDFAGDNLFGDDAPDVAMPRIGGDDSPPAAPLDPLAAGLLGAMDNDPVEQGLFDNYDHVGEMDVEDAAAAFTHSDEGEEDGTASWFTLDEAHALPSDMMADPVDTDTVDAVGFGGSEIEAYADDSDTAESMEWVRGVGLVKRSGGSAKPAAPALLPEPVPVSVPRVVTTPPPVIRTPSSGRELTEGEYEVLEEGYLTAPDEEFDFFDSPSSSGDDVFGTETILDVPEEVGSDPSGRPSRRLRKQR